MKEEWKKKLEKEKSEHDVELKLLKREVEEGIRKRKSLEGTIEIKEKRLEGLERYGNKMDELWKEACKKGD